MAIPSCLTRTTLGHLVLALCKGKDVIRVVVLFFSKIVLTLVYSVTVMTTFCTVDFLNYSLVIVPLWSEKTQKNRLMSKVTYLTGYCCYKILRPLFFNREQIKRRLPCYFSSFSTYLDESDNKQYKDTGH